MYGNSQTQRYKKLPAMGNLYTDYIEVPQYIGPCNQQQGCSIRIRHGYL